MGQDLHGEMERLVRAARDRGILLVAIGAFAVRAYLALPDRRLTRDLDVFVARGQLEKLRELLEEEGFRVYETGPWWKAERRTGSERRIIDIAVDSVVDVASFASWPLDARRACEVAEPGRRPLPVPPLEDVLALKLMSHRDKDVLDVIALMRDAGDRIDPHLFRSKVEARELEIAIRAGYLEVGASARSGLLARLWSERYGERLEDQTLKRALERLDEVFS